MRIKSILQYKLNFCILSSVALAPEEQQIVINRFFKNLLILFLRNWKISYLGVFFKTLQKKLSKASFENFDKRERNCWLGWSRFIYLINSFQWFVIRVHLCGKTIINCRLIAVQDCWVACRTMVKVALGCFITKSWVQMFKTNLLYFISVF